MRQSRQYPGRPRHGGGWSTCSTIAVWVGSVSSGGTASDCSATGFSGVGSTRPSSVRPRRLGLIGRHCVQRGCLFLLRPASSPSAPSRSPGPMAGRHRLVDRAEVLYGIGDRDMCSKDQRGRSRPQTEVAPSRTRDNSTGARRRHASWHRLLPVRGIGRRRRLQADQRDLQIAGAAQQVHHLHQVAIGDRLVGAQEDARLLVALVLLSSVAAKAGRGTPSRRATASDRPSAVRNSGVSGPRRRRRGRARQIDLHIDGRQRRRDHEDDQQHQDDVDERRDVDLVDFLEIVARSSPVMRPAIGATPPPARRRARDAARRRSRSRRPRRIDAGRRIGQDRAVAGDGAGETL